MSRNAVQIVYLPLENKGPAIPIFMAYNEVSGENSVIRLRFVQFGYMGAMRLAPTWVVRMTCWSKLSAISRCLMA